jgi:hypothetical protein
MNSVIGRVVATAGVIAVYGAANTTHEIISPLISGPMAAQQLSDSNAAYVGTQIVSRTFNGSGFNGGLLGLVLLAALVAIWYTPIRNIFRTSEKA